MSTVHDSTPLTHPDPSVYRLAPDHFHIMVDLLYDRLGDRYQGAMRRILISLGWGIGVYLVGFLLAASIGFLTTYLNTAAVYVVIVCAVIVIDQMRALKIRFMACLNDTREAFLVTDQRYAADLEAVLRPGTARGPVFGVALLVIVPFALAIAALYAQPSSPLSTLARAIMPPSFTADWFSGPDLAEKAMIIGWLLLVISLILASVFFVSLVVIFGWPRLVLHWPVVPVPSYVATRFRDFITFFAHALLIYAIAVLATILLYGGRLEIGLIALAAVFSLLGLLCLLIPLYTVRQLVNRARSQVMTAVARRYREAVYPVASSDASEDASHDAADGRAGAADAPGEAYSELGKLEELMQGTQAARDGVVDLIVVIPVVCSQFIPFLGFLVPLIGAR